MENTPSTNRKVIHLSRAKLAIGLVVLIVAALLILGGLGRMRMRTTGLASPSSLGMSGGFNMMEGGGSIASDIPSVTFGGDSYRPSSYPYPGQTQDISDTREFLKTSYSAQIKTRSVAETIKDIKNSVRDAEGRVDNFSSGQKYGSISFVVPKSNFEQFRDEIEALTHKKLYTEDISSQNLLNQKQGIEQSASMITSSLAQLESQKKASDAAHVTKIANLSAEITAVGAQLAATRDLLQDSKSSAEKTQFEAQITILVAREATLKYNKDQENKSYAASNNSLVAQIDQQKRNLEGNVKQDIAFENNIETVSGSIGVSWVSVWQMMKIFSPIHPTIIIIVLVVACWYYLYRKSFLPKIEFV